MTVLYSCNTNSLSLLRCDCVQDVTAVTDNEAVLQQRVTKGTNQFLSTLAAPGEAQFLTVLKPCSILLPHVHPRANEFYSVIFGAPPPSLIAGFPEASNVRLSGSYNT